MPKKFYAVANGRSVGVYDNWTDCRGQVDGFPGARYKGFETQAEAQAFVQSGGGRQQQSAPISNNSSSSSIQRDSSQGPIVYTDGACTNNGYKGAKAGYGVYWGPDHPLNKSEPITDNVKPTNNRAEMTAIVEAMKTAKENDIQNPVIRTDSNLGVRTLKEWSDGWEARGWKKSDGSEIKNLDLVQQAVQLQRETGAEIEYVPGHNGIHGNEEADRLANEGAARYRN